MILNHRYCIFELLIIALNVFCLLLIVLPLALQLSDFGLATWTSSCSHHMGTSDVAGTFGLVLQPFLNTQHLTNQWGKLIVIYFSSYLAPEYFMNGKLNDKLDVYAFGVVLLELLSGRKPIDDGFPKGKESLVMWVSIFFFPRVWTRLPFFLIKSLLNGFRYVHASFYDCTLKLLEIPCFNFSGKRHFEGGENLRTARPKFG